MPQPPQQLVVYTPHQVAALAHCVVQTIYRHLEDGQFPNARVIGKRKWLIPERDVVAYLGYDPKELKVILAN